MDWLSCVYFKRWAWLKDSLMIGKVGIRNMHHGLTNCVMSLSLSPSSSRSSMGRNLWLALIDWELRERVVWTNHLVNVIVISCIEKWIASFVLVQQWSCDLFLFILIVREQGAMYFDIHCVHRSHRPEGRLVMWWMSAWSDNENLEISYKLDRR